jgi:CheY-like chemotaxis protein
VIPFPSDVDDLLPPLQSHDRMRRVLTPIVNAGVASLLLVIAVGWPVARWPELAALGVEASALVGSVLLIRRRKIRASVWLNVVAFVLASAAVVLSYGSRRITSFARPKEPQQRRVHRGEVLHEVLRLLRPTIPAGISLVVRDDADAPPILADSAQVHETILNLTTNAVYAIGSWQVGVVTYTLDSVVLTGEAASAADVPAGRSTRLTTRDTGPGMNTETQRRIFDAFYTTKSVGEGSGLGLPMASGTMRSHGGAIPVDSRIGEGATFQLLFPSAPVSEPEPLAPSVPDIELPPQLRVLFVDDEPQLVRLAQRTLAPFGHTVTSVSSPLEAVEAFRATPLDFDVVMTDLSMPGMSGIDLARAVRSERADVPIVLITGYADETDERAARDAGVTRLAVKASDARELTRLLAEVIGQPVSS